MRCAEKRLICSSPYGFHDMVYSDWGDPSSKRVLVCVHGLTRNGKDFDPLAERLVDRGFRVICPDIVGRGRSDWLHESATYHIPQYIADLTVLLAHEHLRAVNWLGTSMGGLIAMSMVAMTGHPIRRLILNDVGPLVPKAALARIGTYVGKAWRFENHEDAVAHLKEAYATFGLTSDEDWARFAENSLTRGPDGCWMNAYDPRIAEPFRDAEPQDLDLWPLWAAVDMPALVLRGADSDLLLPDTIAEMKRRKPELDVVEFPKCGHAPMLYDDVQIGAVVDWLERHAV